MWLATGLTEEQVDEVMASNDKLSTGLAIYDKEWKNNREEMRKRRKKANQKLKERGEVLVLTGAGALDAELANNELAKAYAGVWATYAEGGILPHVERTEDGKVRIWKVGKDGENELDLVMSEEDADSYLQGLFNLLEERELIKRQQLDGPDAEPADLKETMLRSVGEIAGGAMLREAEKSGVVRVEDITQQLPPDLAKEVGALIKAAGGVNRLIAEKISDWARGMIAGLVDSGVSEAEARASKEYAEGAVMSLGSLEGFAALFAERGEMVEGSGGEVYTTLFRTRGGKESVVDGIKVLGSTMFAVPGRASGSNVVEDVAESVFDEMVQARAVVLAGEQNLSYADAEKKAWAELAGIVGRARSAVLKADSSAHIPEPKADSPLSVTEAFSAIARNKFILSSVVPAWMAPLVEAAKGTLTAAAAVGTMKKAWAAALEADPQAAGALADLLEKVGVRVGEALAGTRIEAQDVVAWRVAHGYVMSRANGPDGVGGVSVSETVRAAEDEEQAILEREAPASEETLEEVKQEQARAEEQAERLMKMQEQGSNAPEQLQGVFDGDTCAYNATGGYWFGMIQKSKLVKSTEQVKVGTKGKHGVIAGRELVGNFQASAAPLYVWKRKNGELWLISGRHRYELMMRDNGVDSHPCYVFLEDAEHDEKWARMMDYENNMRDDQADELTAATYVRETGLTDEELKVRGLMRNASRSKRGALIGRHAREELWTRFSNEKIKPIDAEIICNLTRHIKDQSRVDEIQRRCCMLLDEGRGWDFIGGMVQLMANKKNVVMRQGLLDFGADFEADMARAAEWIEKNLGKIKEAITLLKQGRKLSGKKRAEAERLGITTATQKGSEDMLHDLELLKGKFELIGSYPDLVAQAELWDGKTDVDPVGIYLEQVRQERAQAATEKEMEAEEYLKAQQAEATGMLSLSAEMRSIKERAIADGTFMKAPNGKPTKLTERQWLMVRTAAFKRWFGDWENDPANASKVVDENGEPLVVYHGARHAGFVVFDSTLGDIRSNAPEGTMFFSSSRAVAYSYSGSYDKPDLWDKNLQQEIEDYGIEEMPPGIYPVFLNIRDPHSIDFKGRNWNDGDFYSLVDDLGVYIYPKNGDEFYESEEAAQERAAELELENYEIYPEYKDTNLVAEEAQDMGADGAIIENVVDEGSYGSGIPATDFVVWNANQVKSATDNRGTFDAGSADITFSTGRNLAAVHSLSPEKFLAALELGGMPMPSVAVTRLDKPYSWGGTDGIMLVGRPEMVDPRKRAKVYMHDAYTGKMPPVMYRKKNDADAAKLKADVLEKISPYGLDYSDGLNTGLFRDDYNEKVMDAYAADWSSNRAMMAYWAITQAGYAPKPKLKEQVGMIKKELYKVLKPWEKMFPKDTMLFSYHYTDEILNKLRALMIRYYEEKNENKTAEHYRNISQDALQMKAQVYVDAVRKFTTKKVPDAVENGKRFVAYAERHRKAYNAWCEEQLSRFRGEKIFSRKFVRRNWRGEVVDEWWGHESYNLKNLMKYMREEKSRGGEFSSLSPGLFIAVVSEELRSMKEIQFNRERVVGSEEHEKAKAEYEDAYSAFERLAWELGAGRRYGRFEIAESAMWRLLKLVQGSRNMPSREAVKRKLNESKDGWQDEHVEAAMDLLSRAFSLPSDYMEAVPQRAVQMNEWEYAVMPESLKKNKPVMAGLRENGIKPIFYDSTEEGRKAALAGLVDNPTVSFSVEEAQARGLMEDGVLETQNALVVAPGVSFSIKALHASPHRFRKFTTDKMGTGEGYQAFGWGLYFSGDEGSNRYYYGRFSSYRDSFVVDGKEMEGLEGYKKLYNELRDILLMYGRDELYMSEMNHLLGLMHEGYTAADIKRDSKSRMKKKRKAYKDAYYTALEEIEERGLKVVRVDMPAANYRVELNVDDSNLLLWNKRYSGQEIKDLLGEELFEQVYDEGDEEAELLDNGEGVYMLLVSVAGGKKGASELLLKHGVRGIKYFDDFSRHDNNENKTYNYVIFSGDDVKITGVNETGDYNAPWNDYEDTTASFSMVHVPLYQEILDTFEQRIAKDGSVVWSSRVSGEDSMLICAYPEVLNMIIPWKRDVIASRDVVQKLMNKHGLLPQDVAKLPQALWNPVAVFEDPDVDKGFIVITDILAPNFSPKRKTKKKNKDQQVRQMKQVMAVLELRADKNNAVITEVVSAYSADSTGKYKKLIENGFLRYADTERALTWASAEGDSVLQLLTTALLHSGSGVILKDGLQNVNTDFSASMARVTQRSMELLEARSEEEVAQDIMADMRAACERLSVVLADDDVDARRGTGLKVYAEMQALMSAVRAALPEKYLRQGNLDMLLRWASVYAQMAQNGNVPARGAIKGKAFDMFVDALQRQAERDRLQGMTEEEARDALMEIASDKLETAFLKVARDSVRRLDQFLKDRALERIEWLYTHAYPTREEGKAWSRGKMDAENYRIVNAAWALVRGSLDKRKAVELEMKVLRRAMRSVREEMKEGKVPEEEGKRRLKKLNEQMQQKELEAMKAAAEEQANAIKAISDELEALSTEDAGYERDEAAANEKMALQQTFGNWYYKDALEARRAARVFENMVLRGKKLWEEKLQAEREEMAYWREQILAGFEVSREEATNVRMAKRNEYRTELNKQLIGMGKGFMNFGHLMLALRPLLGKRFCEMKREQISQMHTNTMAFNTELKGWMFETLRKITGLKTEEEQAAWLQEQNMAADTGIYIREREVRKAVLTHAEAKRWLAMSAEEAQAERARLIAEAAKMKRRPSNMPTEAMMEDLKRAMKEYEADNHGIEPKDKKFRLQSEETWTTQLHTTKDAILFGILTFEQPDYEHLMEANGITPETLDQMRRYVGPKMLQWGYAMRAKLSEHGVNVARVFEAYTGIPFDARENYFKGVFDQGALKEQTLEQAVSAASGASGTGSKYGSLIPRRYHQSKINWDTSAAGVFVTSMQQQNNYVQTAKMVRGWRALLMDKAFSARVEAEIGAGAMQQIRGWIELIEGAVVADVKMAELSKRMMRRLMGGFAKARLGGNIRTLIKQVSALLNGYAGGYVPDSWMLNNELCQEMTYHRIGFGEFMMALARVMTMRGAVNREEMKAQPFIYARQAVDGDSLLHVSHLAANQKQPGQMSAEDWLGWKAVPASALAWLGGKAERVVERFMNAIAIVDAEMCTASAMAIADVAYRNAKAQDKDGVIPDEVKRAEALRIAGMALDVAGQPQLRTQKGYWAASGAMGGLGDFLFMFRSDTLSKAGLWIAQMSSGEKKAAVGGWVAFGVMNSLVLAMLEGLRGNLWDDDDEWWQLGLVFLADVATNDLSALPVAGDVLRKVRSMALGERFFESGGLADLVPFGEVLEYGKREWKNIEKGASWDRHWNATAGMLRALGSSCAICQESTIGPLANLSSLTMAAAVLGNATQFVEGLIKLGIELEERD